MRLRGKNGEVLRSGRRTGQVQQCAVYTCVHARVPGTLLIIKFGENFQIHRKRRLPEASCGKILPAVETRSTVSGKHIFKWTSVLHSHLTLQQLAVYTRIRMRVPGRPLEIWIKFPV